MMSRGSPFLSVRTPSSHGMLPFLLSMCLSLSGIVPIMEVDSIERALHMLEEPQEITGRYRLTLEFDVYVSTEILQPYSDEHELTPKEQGKLQAQRSLMSALLSTQYRYLLDELNGSTLSPKISVI